MIVLTGESGSGKTSTERALELRGYKRAISHTTRDKRVGDEEGVDYYFVTKEDMELLRQSGRLVERVEYLGNVYALVEEECQDDRVVVVEPDGLRQLQEKKELDLFVVYLYASKETRRERMINRGDKLEKVQERLENDDMIFRGIGDKAHIIINTEDKSVEQVANLVLDKYIDR